MSPVARSPEVSRLQGLYRHIERHRMSGVPILNPALRVKAVGFRPWNGYQLGVLITPWFMNLVLLGEGDAGDLDRRRVGEKVPHRFPSGRYEFIVAEEATLGRYQVCSLFSPMQAFDSQALAEETAQEVMSGLMQAQHRSDITNDHQHEMVKARGAEVPDGGVLVSASGELTQGDRLHKPLSRRRLLIGTIDD